MSIPALVECSKELRRLAIAGSSLAKDDFRLKRLIEPMRASAEKAPVFGKVADQIEALVSSKSNDSAGALLDLATLCHAILYTQGQTGRSGELQELETIDTGLTTTDTPAKIMKPLIDALTSQGGGREAIIRDAWNEGQFKDLRLIGPALSALDDTYSYIAEFMADTVLPSYGKVIVPIVKSQFDIKGGQPHARRLKLLSKVLGRDGWELYVEALNEGSKEVRIAAIECLAVFGDALPLLTDMTTAKQADVRAAALQAVGSSNTDQAVDALIAAIKGKDLQRAVGPIRHSKNERLLTAVLDECDSAITKMIKEKKGKEATAAGERAHHLLECLAQRKEPEAIEKLGTWLDKAADLRKVKTSSYWGDGEDVLASIAALIAKNGDEDACRKLIAAGDEDPGVMFHNGLTAATRVMDTAEFYDHYSPLLKAAKPAGDKKKKKRTKGARAEKDKQETLIDFILSGGSAGYGYYRWRYWHYHDEDDDEDVNADDRGLDKWDDRWLDDAIKHDHQQLVVSLVRPGHQPSIDYLLKKYEKAKADQTDDLLQGLAFAKHPGFVDLLCDEFRKVAKRKYRWLWWLYNLMYELELDELDKVEAVAAELPDKVAMELLERLAEVRPKLEAKARAAGKEVKAKKVDPIFPGAGKDKKATTKKAATKKAATKKSAAKKPAARKKAAPAKKAAAKKPAAKKAAKKAAAKPAKKAAKKKPAAKKKKK